jgi:hypothetical protein
MGPALGLMGTLIPLSPALAALSSIDLAPSVLQRNDAQQTGAVPVPGDSVIAKPGEEANTIQLQPGEEVVGQGEPVGTVYRLDDGRTVIVRPGDAAPVPGEDVPGDGRSGGSGSTGSRGSEPATATPPGASDTPSPDSATGGAGAPSDDALTAPQPSTGAP